MNDDPLPIEDFLASVTEALKIRGDARAITVIAEGESRFDSWFNEDGYISSWTLKITLPIHIFYALSDEERRSTAEAIEEAARPFFASTPDDDLRSVVITLKVSPATETWREFEEISMQAPWPQICFQEE